MRKDRFNTDSIADATTSSQVRGVLLGGPTLLVALCLVCAAQLQAQSLAGGAGVSPAGSVADSTPPDAVIELWEQHWTLNDDGSIVYHEKKHMRLNSDRTYRSYADPRITYNVDTDELEILVARVRRPDGTYRELPDYSHVKVAPNASQGWPAFASIRQHLLVMSGVEPGCVTELEYRITTKPGVRPYMAAQIEPRHRFPIRERKLTVKVPSNVTVGWADPGPPPITPPAGVKQAFTFSFTMKKLPAMPPEPQSPPPHRMAFSTAGLASEWLEHRHAQLEAAADESDMIKDLAPDWTEDVKDPSEQLRALQKNFAQRFNFVEFPVAWRPATVRPASEVIACNYGLPAEAAAALLALARAADLPALPGVLVHDEVWDKDAPQDGMVAAYVVLLVTGQTGEVRMRRTASGDHVPTFDTGRAPEIWHPHDGRILRDSHWAGCRLLPVPDVLMPRIVLPAWTDPDESRCEIRGKITLDDDGGFAGDLTIRSTGLFVSLESLRAEDAQQKRLKALLKRLLPGAQVKSFSVTTLADSTFEATAHIATSKPLQKLGDAYCLRLAEHGPGSADVSFPLDHATRDNPVRLTGAFAESVDLTIAWPDGWTVDARPSDVGPVAGDWGSVAQSVILADQSLRLQRQLLVTQRELPPDDFLALRTPLNELRSEHARTLILRP